MTASRYGTLSIQDLFRLQIRLLEALANPRCANRAQVRTWLAEAQRQFAIATGVAG